MSYLLARSVALGASQTGLTVTAQLVDADAVNVGALQTTVVEVGAGIYLAKLTVPDTHIGGVKFLVGATVRGFWPINPGEVELNDVKTSTRLSTPQGVARNVELPHFHFVMLDPNGEPATGLTVACRVTLDDGTEADCANSPATETANGGYRITLTAAELDARVIKLRASAAGVRDLTITVLTVE